MKPGTGTSRRALATLAIVASAAATAPADDWVVRPVRLGDFGPGPARNVDVLIRGAGVSVGYTLGASQSLFLSTLAAGQDFFRHQTAPGPAVTASFAADSAGFVHYAYRASGTLRTGVDTGGWGLGMIDGAHTSGSSLSLRTPFPVIEVDSHGIPALVATDPNGQRVLSRFDVPSATWRDQTVPMPGALNFTTLQTGFDFTPDDRAIIAYLNITKPVPELVVAIEDGALSWRTFASSFIDPSSAVRGISVAALPDGGAAVAYNAPDGLRVDLFDGNAWSSELVSPVRSHLLPRSLTVDAAGQLALAYAPRATNILAPLHVARRSDTGWTDETLPVSGWYGSIAFDSANNPYVGVFNGVDVLLAGPTIPSLRPADLTLDGAVTADDVPALAQAIRHPDTFLASRPDLTTADLVAIADRDGDLRLTPNDARLLIDSLSSSPLPGLPDRTAGYLALDQADLDPAIGSGTGNFFATTLSTGAPYSPADSRADLTGPAGTPDGIIDTAEADLLVAALSALPAPTSLLSDISQLATGNSLLDLNLDGIVDAADLHTLIHDILQTTEGDANLNGRIDPDDFALVDRGFATQLAGWSAGDFNADGSISSDDYLLLDESFALQSGPLSPAFLAMRESRFGPDYVSQLLTNIPEPSCLASSLLAGYPLLGHRRRRRR